MNVYRRPFEYAQRYASRVEWQPQPSWTFDATTASWGWTTYPASYTLGIPCTTAAWAWQTYLATVTVSGDIDIAANAAAWAWTTYRATQSSSKQIDCAVAEWSWEGRAATLVATRFTSAVTDIRARAARNSINARTTHADIRANAARNTILARVA